MKVYYFKKEIFFVNRKKMLNLQTSKHKFIIYTLPHTGNRSELRDATLCSNFHQFIDCLLLVQVRIVAVAGLKGKLS